MTSVLQGCSDQDHDSELIDCRTNGNRDFNARMLDMGRPELCVAEFYTRAEIAEMREKCKRWLA
jgi:hypothetical protein